MLNNVKKSIKDALESHSKMIHLLKCWKKPMPIYTPVIMPGLKVHLGSGDVNLQGWINIDARFNEHVHIVSEGFNLDKFSDEAIDEIYMCHVLEHFSFKEAEDLLHGFKKKLRYGGVIRISVPDIDRLIEIYRASNKNLDKVKYALMGGQDYEYNFHKSIYNEVSLRNLLHKCGFNDIVVWDTKSDFGVDIGDWSTGIISSDIGKIPVSINLKGKCVAS